MPSTPAVSKLRAWIVAQGLTIREFARVIHVSSHTVHHWFYSGQRPTMARRKSIEKLTQKEVLVADWIFSDEWKSIREKEKKIETLSRRAPRTTNRGSRLQRLRRRDTKKTSAENVRSVTRST